MGYPNLFVRILLRILSTTILLTLGLILSVPPLFKVLLRAIANPRKAFSKKKRTNPPTAYVNASLGRHECANVNGIQMYYVTGGDPKKPLMLFLHGFPECWYSWRYQLKYQEFQDQYRLVAVDLRGYGRSSKPSYFPGAYHRDNVVEDIRQLIMSLGYEACVLVAHDWGGSVAHHFARLHPDYVDKLVVMDCPEDRVFQSFANANKSQYVKSMYMAFFQVPFIPEFLFSMFDYAFINTCFRKKPVGIVNKEMMTDEDIEVFKWNASQRRTLTGSLNYYRCLPAMFFPIVLPKRKPAKRFSMPVLIMWGDSDSALDPDMAKAHEDSGLYDDITVRVVPSASHWLQQDQPEVVNQIMLTWLISRGKK